MHRRKRTFVYRYANLKEIGNMLTAFVMKRKIVHTNSVVVITKLSAIRKINPAEI